MQETMWRDFLNLRSNLTLLWFPQSRNGHSYLGIFLWTALWCWLNGIFRHWFITFVSVLDLCKNKETTWGISSWAVDILFFSNWTGSQLQDLVLSCLWFLLAIGFLRRCHRQRECFKAVSKKFHLNLMKSSLVLETRKWDYFASFFRHHFPGS